MAGVNKVILIGNLGKDPEVRHLESGAAVANFPIATTETYKDKNGERHDRTEWHNIVIWRGLAEVAEKYLRKGSQVYIEGRLQNRSWEDKEGNTRYITEVVGNNLTMLGSKSDNSNNQNTAQVADKEPAVAESKNTENGANDDSDDLPF